MDKPKISIIVPVYNVEKYLSFCVDSLLRQTYTDFEILLIDDGSKDNSGKLCDDLKLKDNRITVYHKPNGGLSDARNFGIEHSNGDFYLFIDSDDALHPDFCKVLMELQKKYNADITACSMRRFYDYSKISEFDKAICSSTEKVVYDKDILIQYFNPEGRRFIAHGLCMKLYKKELFKKNRFAVGRLHEDLFITHQLLSLSHCFVFTDLPYYYYYQQNTNSICKNYQPKNFTDEIDAISLMMASYKNNPDIIPHLELFIADHYMYLITRFYGYLNKHKELEPKKNALQKWLKQYLKTEPDLSFKYKLKKYIKLTFPHLYAWYKKNHKSDSRSKV
jgi:glycosyltransferase involved in cell wall biosynthesis